MSEKTALAAFFDGRSIGVGLNGTWFWRGKGYDEGWDDVTVDDLRRLRDLLDEVTL